MNIQNLILKLKVQAAAMQRGIHSDYALIEREDLKQLLDDHDKLTKLLWSNVDRSVEQWRKELGEQLDNRMLDTGKICDMVPKACKHAPISMNYSVASDAPVSPLAPDLLYPGGPTMDEVRASMPNEPLK
jgi:hypothetical protein